LGFPLLLMWGFCGLAGRTWAELRIGGLLNWAELRFGPIFLVSRVVLLLLLPAAAKPRRRRRSVLLLLCECETARRCWRQRLTAHLALQPSYYVREFCNRHNGTGSTQADSPFVWLVADD
jgi:hypothetical protein